jgi:AraC family transcriptional regulator
VVEDLLLRAIARAVGMSQHHFAQTFKQSREDALSQIPSSTPILSSSKTTWNGICVDHLLHPAGGMSECCLPDYTISIHIGSPIELEQVADGQRISDRRSHGDIILSPPNLHRRLCWDREAELLILRLEPTFFTHAADKFGDSNCIQVAPQMKLCDPLIQQIGLALKAELEEGCPSSPLYGESLGTALIVHLLKQHSTSKPNIRDYEDGLPKRKLNQALEYINSHLDQEIRLADIAEAVGISQYYFSRLFKQSTGLTPHQYLVRRRLEKAKILLTSTDLAIAQIAQQIGFASQSHFTTLFRKHTGVTPKAYRNAL